MTIDEFILFRDVIIKNDDHKRVVNAFYGYLSSVSGNSRLLINEVGRIINIDISSLSLNKGCFNGIFDNTVPPYDAVDFYIRLSNDVCVFMYGNIPRTPLKKLKDNAYVVFMLANDTGGIIERSADRHIYIR